MKTSRAHARWGNGVRAAALHLLMAGLAVLHASASMAAPVRAAPRRGPAAIAAAGAALRESLQAEVGKVGALSSWQKRVLEEEVLSQPQSYVLQERTEADGSSKFEFDVETVKRLLSLGCGDAPNRCGAGVLVRAVPGCGGCKQKVPLIQKLVEAHLARRGFKPVALSQAILADDLSRARSELPPSENSLEPSEWESERAWQNAIALHATRSSSASNYGALPESAGAAEKSGAPRALVLVSIQELQDSSHSAPDAPSEEAGRPALRIALAFRERAGGTVGGVDDWTWAVARWTGVHAQDSIEGPLGRLFGDTVSELVVKLGLGFGSGGRSVVLESSARTRGAAEPAGFSIRVLGVRDFQQYTRTRNVLSAAIQAAGFTEPLEQALRRGEALWRVMPGKPGADTGALTAALAAALRNSRPGDPGLGEKPNLRVLDLTVTADRERLETLADPDEDHPLFRDATLTVELPAEERRR